MNAHNRVTVTENVNNDASTTQVSRETDGFQLVNELRKSLITGQGYVEISSSSCDFPTMCVSYADEKVVVQAFPDAETSTIMHGSGALAANEIIELPVMGEMTPFTGEFILSAGEAIKAVEQFVKDFNLDTAGQWHRL